MRTIRIGRLVVGRIPRLVGTVSSVAALKRAARLKKRPFDMLEVRADLLTRETALWTAVRSAGVPTILTIRSRDEGGAWRRNEAERKALYLAHLDAVDAVDVEIRSPLMSPVARAARKRRRIVIGSFHDFKSPPRLDTLRRVIARGRAAGAHIVKIAVTVRRAADLHRLLTLLKESGGPLCVVGMGPLGGAARITLACAGSCLTYGYVDRPVAPGQPSCRELAERLGRECPGWIKERRAGPRPAG